MSDEINQAIQLLKQAIDKRYGSQQDKPLGQTEASDPDCPHCGMTGILVKANNCGHPGDGCRLYDDTQAFDFNKIDNRAFCMNNETAKPVIKDRLQETLDREQELIRELNEMEESRNRWETSAKKLASEVDSYYNVLSKIGKELGPDAYTDDDGVRVDTVLVAKLHDLTQRMISRGEEARYELSRIGGRLVPHYDVMNSNGELQINRLDPAVAYVLSQLPVNQAGVKPSPPGPSTVNQDVIALLRKELSAMTEIAAKRADELASCESELRRLSVTHNTVRQNFDGCRKENEKLKLEYSELRDAYHGVNLAHNELQRKVSNARNQLDNS